MKAFEAFRKPFEAPQRSEKIKIYVNFFSLSGITNTDPSGSTPALLDYQLENWLLKTTL